MITKVQKWGNSLALRIPKALASYANITAGTAVNIQGQQGRIIIEPVRGPHYDLDDLLCGDRRWQSARGDRLRQAGRTREVVVDAAYVPERGGMTALAAVAALCATGSSAGITDAEGRWKMTCGPKARLTALHCL